MSSRLLPEHFTPFQLDVGRHDRADARRDRVDVAREVDAPQRRFVHPRVALVEAACAVGLATRAARAPGRAAVADVVLGAGQARQRIGEVRCPAGRAPRPRPARGPAPGPRRSPRRCGPSGSSCGTVTQGAKVHWMPVARTSSAVTRPTSSTSFALRVAPRRDVVREDHRADHVVVAVDGVDAVEDRDLEPRLGASAWSRRSSPASPRTSWRLRVGVAAREERAQVEVVDVARLLEELSRSGCVICPIFSSSVICATRASISFS